MTALRDDERLFCAICGDEARYSRVGKTSVIVFGHIGRKRQDHPVRLAPASRSARQHDSGRRGIRSGSRTADEPTGTPEPHGKRHGVPPIDPPAQGSTSARGGSPPASPLSPAPTSRRK